MGAEFFDILKPPQSIDTLDAWGALDNLPYSLDSSMWARVGVCGFVASEGGRSGEALGEDSVVRGLVLSSGGKTAGSLAGAKVAYLSGSGKARSGGAIAVSVVRGVGGRSTAKGTGSLKYLTIRALFDTEPGTSGGSMLGVKVSYLSGTSAGAGRGEATANFIRSLGALTVAEAGGRADVGRVLTQSAESMALSSDSCVVTFKGWNWNGEKTAPAPEWEQETAEPSPWVQKEQNAAVWAAHGVTAKDWTQKQGGAAQWR